MRATYFWVLWVCGGSATISSCASCAGPSEDTRRPTSVPSAATSLPVDSPLDAARVVAADGSHVDAFATLTKSFSADEGLPSMIGCEAGTVPWLAGGRAAAGGFVVCLPADLRDGGYTSKVLLSLSRPSLRGPRRARRSLELIHTWWQGGGQVNLTVRARRVEIDGSVTLHHRTQPASFMGGYPSETVRIEGAATWAP